MRDAASTRPGAHHPRLRRAIGSIAALVATVGLATLAPQSVNATVPPLDEDTLTAARSGLVTFLADNPPADPPENPARPSELPECPLLELDQLQASADELGYTEPLLDFSALPLASYLAAIAPDLPGVSCAADIDGDSRDAGFGLYVDVLAVDLGSDDLVLDFYGTVGRGTVGMMEAPSVPGAKIYWSCWVDEHELRACLAFWTDEGFVVGVNLWSNEFEVTKEQTFELLVDLFPTIIDNLGAGATGDDGVDSTQAITASSAAAPVASDMTAVDDAEPSAAASESATTEPAASESASSEPSESASEPGDVPATEPDDAPAGGVEDPQTIVSARAGLERLLAVPAPPPAAPPAPCPVLDAGAIEAANTTAGIDVALAQWTAEPGADVGSAWGTVGIACSGHQLEADSDLIEFEMTVVVADADSVAADPDGDLDADGLVAQLAAGELHEPLTSPTVGSTVGRCDDGDRFDHCVEFWQADGLVVGLSVTDAVYIDRSAMHAVLERVVPDVVANLVDGSTDVADPLAAISADEVEVSALAVESYVGGSDADDVTCPVLSPSELQPSLDDAGLAIDLASWQVDVSTNDGARLTCRTNGQAIRVDVIAFTDAAEADDFVASVALPDGGSGGDLEFGDLTVGSCTSVSSRRFCTEWWRQDRLAIGVTLFGGSGTGIGSGDAAAVLVEIIPTLLANSTALSASATG